MRGADRGTIALVGAAFGFSTISIFTELATRAGTPLLTAMSGRYVIAAAILVPLAGGPRGMRLPLSRIAGLAGLGSLGQAAVAVLALSALEYISAATTVFLFYTFPAWVVLRAAVTRSEHVGRKQLISLALSFSGVGVMVGLPGSDAVHPLGALLSLSAAVVYALYIPLIGRVSAGIAPVIATSWTATGAAVLFVGASALTGRLIIPSTWIAWASMAGLGVISTALAFVLFLKGLERLGPVRTAIVTTVEPFFVALLAALVLKQPITMATIVGGSLIASAVLVLQRTR